MKKHFYLYTLLLALPVLMSEKGYDGVLYVAPSKTVAQAGIVINGNSMYIADNKEIVTYDISQPARPEALARYYIEDGIDTLYRYEQYLVAGSDGISSTVYDISTPSQLRTAGLAWEWSSCSKVIIYANQAFVVSKPGYKCTGDNDQDAIRMFNLNATGNAEYVTSFTLAGILEIAATESTLYVSRDNVGLVVINTATKEVVNTLSDNIYYDMKIAGNKLYARSKRTLDCFDITIPQAPILISQLPN
jgi:hypothetical protein